jgi:predicted ATP-grasp superfamily ATP-dependent carboligase
LLRLLSRRGTLLGPEPVDVRAVRRPEILFSFLASEGIPCARLAPGGRAPEGARPGAWLAKPRHAAGGLGIREAGAGEASAPGEFVQERLEGACGSAAFVADGRDAMLLGTSEQIVGGEPLGEILGAPPFRYAGSIVGPPGHFLDAAAEARLMDAGGRIARRFRLRGLFGLDVIRVRGEAHVIEVNPRWTASMELIEERCCGDGADPSDRPLFDLHLRALREPIVRIGSAPAPKHFVAKGILWADRPMTAPDPEVLTALGARDRPRRSERFLPGNPVCTLVVEGPDAETCRRALEARAHDARRSL